LARRELTAAINEDFTGSSPAMTMYTGKNSE